MFPSRPSRLRRFLQWFRRLSPGYVEGKISSPYSFHGYENHTHLNIEIYQTTKITEENDRWPEQNTARFLGQALKDAEYNYTIHFDLPPLDIPDSAERKNLDAFRDTNPSGDLNILIGYRWGGGWGGPNHAITAGKLLDEKLDLVTVAPHGPDDRVGFPYKHILNLLHEVGHMLGSAHSDEALDEPSLLWSESGKSAFDNPPAVPEE